jgi:putative lipoprotein
MALIVSRRAIAKAVLLIAATAATPAAMAADENQPGGLFGIEWHVTELAGMAPIADHIPTLTLESNGRAGGNTGCNIYFAMATIDAAAIRFSEPGTTYIACAEEVMAQEQAYLEALGQAAHYRLDGAGLELLDSHGVLLVRYVATA